MSDQDAENHFNDLIGDFDNAMLVSRATTGELRARPMSIADHRDGGDLFFITDKDSAKTDEIAAEPDVAVTLQSGSKFVSISGTARVDDNRALIKQLYSPPMKAWFPEGVDDPNMIILRLTPTHGEYWDQSGLKRFEYLWKAGKALWKGENLGEKSLSGHAEVKPG